jgi:hypothetical protein
MRSRCCLSMCLSVCVSRLSLLGNFLLNLLFVFHSTFSKAATTTVAVAAYRKPLSMQWPCISGARILLIRKPAAEQRWEAYGA